MNDLKESWKETGKGLGNAFKGLGKSIIKSADAVVDKAEDWAHADDTKEQTAQPHTAPQEDDAWICPQCGARAMKKFCPECGTQKPE